MFGFFLSFSLSPVVFGHCHIHSAHFMNLKRHSTHIKPSKIYLLLFRLSFLLVCLFAHLLLFLLLFVCRLYGCRFSLRSVSQESDLSSSVRCMPYERMSNVNCTSSPKCLLVDRCWLYKTHRFFSASVQLKTLKKIIFFACFKVELVDVFSSIDKPCEHCKTLKITLSTNFGEPNYREVFFCLFSIECSKIF